jgi:hypothetical protein
MRSSAITGAVLLALYAGLASAQTYDPQTVLDSLIQRQLQDQARRDWEAQQAQQRAAFYASLSDQQLMQQTDQFCPIGGPVCSQQLPTELAQEGIRRRLIPTAPLPPGMDCVTMGDGEGGGITECDAR